MSQQRESRQKRAAMARAELQLQKRGIIQRANETRRVLASGAFELRFARARRESPPATNLEEVRSMVVGVLEKRFGLDLSDLLLTFAWEPTSGQLDIECHATPGAVVEAFAAAGLGLEDIAKLA